MPRLKSETIGTGDQSWLGSTHGIWECRTETIDVSAFTKATHYPDGYFKSGLPVALVAKRLVPFASSTDEVQTVTEGGSGLTSFTLTFSGQTTAAIAAAATAAAVQAALEALSNINVGDVTVTGADGGPYTVTFGGTLADADVPQMTATPTGGTGTVTVATTTAGGAAGASDGSQVLAGFLFTDQPTDGVADIPAPLLDHGRVKIDNLPVNFTVPAAANVTGQFVFITEGA